MKSKTRIEAIAIGAAAGVVATVPMSLVMLGAQEVGLLGELPPAKITRRLLAVLGVSPSRRERRAATWINHFAFGAAAGGVFGAIGAATRAWRGRRALAKGAAAGAAWGTLVWLVSYAGWVPALDIMPRPSRDRRGRPTMMLLAHWVYGALTGAMTAAGQRYVALRLQSVSRKGGAG